MRKQEKSILVLRVITAFIAAALFFPGLVSAGELEPSAAPGPTMKTLDQIPPTWSEKLDSTDGDATTGCDSSRFECVMDGAAVLDKETGLVWAKDANIADATKTTRLAAMIYCSNLIIADRKGWRLPTVEELASLVDTTQSVPALPNGHPFEDVEYYYWSSTTYGDSPYSARIVSMYNGGVLYYDDNYKLYVWPVRGDN